MRGEHKEGYAPPRTGEQRKTRQPLRIDGLSEEVRKAIQKARSEGKTWEETAELASKAAGESLAVSVVHRWYDLRVDQVNREVMQQSARARAFAAKLAETQFKNLPEAAVALLSSEAFTLAESGDPADRMKAGMVLVRLALQLQMGELEKEKLDLDKKKFVEIAKEEIELAKKKFEQLVAKADKATNDAAAKLGKGKPLTIDDIDRIRERAFGLPPVKREAAGNPTA